MSQAILVVDDEPKIARLLPSEADIKVWQVGL